MAKVLLIDDEPLYYRMMQPVFKEEGHELRYAKNGLDGLAEVSTFLPDVIVTDLRLPDISGFEIAERLRRDPHFRWIPIIFVTGQSELSDKLKAFELGADDYLVKPFQPEELVARLGILVRRSEAARAVAKVEQNRKQTASVISVHSLRGGAGCSTFAVNLAVAFRQLWQKSTLLMDGVLVSGQVALMLNASPRATWADFAGLKADFIDNDVMTQLTQHHQPSEVNFIASPGIPIATDSFTDSFWQTIVEKLKDVNDFIVIDTAHDFNNITIHMLDASSTIILMVNPEMASLRSALCALDIYGKLGFRQEQIFVVVNQTFDQYAIKQTQVEKVIHRPVDMFIPYVPGEFIRSINFGDPYYLKNAESPVGSLFEDAAFWLSNDIHKNLPPVTPTATWRRVQSRLQKKN